MIASSLNLLIFLLPLHIIGFIPITISSNDTSKLTMLSEQESKLVHAICGLPLSSGRKHPWAVSIMKNGRNKFGGTIISPYQILTVAHGFLSLSKISHSTCAMNQLKTFKQIEDIIVSFGDDCNRGYLENQTNDIACVHSNAIHRKIKTVVLDSEFMIKGCRNGHDFAIIELETPIEFNANVRPICLPYLNHYIPETMTIVSFGLKNFFSKSSPLMREFKMKHDPMCEKPDSDKMPTDMPDFICAKAFDPTDYSSPRVCHGDSGASLIQRSPDGRNTLLGEVSFGTPGCPANELVRFTKVDRYLNQICDLTGLCYTLNSIDTKLRSV